MSAPKEVLRTIGFSLRKNSPTILTGLGVAGFFTSIVMAMKATPKAVRMIDAEVFERWVKMDPDNLGEVSYKAFIAVSDEQGYDIFDRSAMADMTFREKVEVAWEPYLPAAGMALLSTGCIIMANRINLRRQAILASLYSLAETSLREYQDKVVETIGTKKSALLSGDISQDKLDANPYDDKTVVHTGKGEMLCYDSLSGRYFFSDIESIRQALNTFNQELLTENEKTLNELYYEMGLSDIEIGDMAGWKADNGLVELSFDAKLAINNEPCVVVNFRTRPQALYFK